MNFDTQEFLAVINLGLSYIVCTVLLTRLYFNRRDCSLLKYIKEYKGALILSTLQVVFITILMIEVITAVNNEETCLNILISNMKILNWDIYVIFSGIIIITANFLQKLFNLKTENSSWRCFRCLFPSLCFCFIFFLGIFLINNSYFSHSDRTCQISPKKIIWIYCVLGSFSFLLVVLTLVIILLGIAENKRIGKQIPNFRGVVIGITIQNMILLCMSVPCFFHYETKVRSRDNIIFWIYSYKFTIITLIWIRYPILLTYLEMSSLCDSNNKTVTETTNSTRLDRQRLNRGLTETRTDTKAAKTVDFCHASSEIERLLKENPMDSICEQTHLKSVTISYTDKKQTIENKKTRSRTKFQTTCVLDEDRNEILVHAFPNRTHPKLPKMYLTTSDQCGLDFKEDLTENLQSPTAGDKSDPKKEYFQNEPNKLNVENDKRNAKNECEIVPKVRCPLSECNHRHLEPDSCQRIKSNSTNFKNSTPSILQPSEPKWQDLHHVVYNEPSPKFQILCRKTLISDNFSPRKDPLIPQTENLKQKQQSSRLLESQSSISSIDQTNYHGKCGSSTKPEVYKKPPKVAPKPFPKTKKQSSQKECYRASDIIRKFESEFVSMNRSNFITDRKPLFRNKSHVGNHQPFLNRPTNNKTNSIPNNVRLEFWKPHTSFNCKSFEKHVPLPPIRPQREKENESKEYSAGAILSIAKQTRPDKHITMRKNVPKRSRSLPEKIRTRQGTMPPYENILFPESARPYEKYSTNFSLKSSERKETSEKVHERNSSNALTINMNQKSTVPRHSFLNRSRSLSRVSTESDFNGNDQSYSQLDSENPYEEYECNGPEDVPTCQVFPNKQQMSDSIWEDGKFIIPIDVYQTLPRNFITDSNNENTFGHYMHVPLDQIIVEPPCACKAKENSSRMVNGYLIPVDAYEEIQVQGNQ